MNMHIKLGTNMSSYTLPKDKTRKLYIRNSSHWFICDEEDWQRSKQVQWFLDKGRIVTGQGQTFEEFNRIIGPRTKMAPLYDMRRVWYIAEVILK